MTKDAKVRVGKTPDVNSGKPSTMVKNGEAVREETLDEVQKALNKIIHTTENDFKPAK